MVCARPPPSLELPAYLRVLLEFCILIAGIRPGDARYFLHPAFRPYRLHAVLTLTQRQIPRRGEEEGRRGGGDGPHAHAAPHQRAGPDTLERSLREGGGKGNVTAAGIIPDSCHLRERGSKAPVAARQAGSPGGQGPFQVHALALRHPPPCTSA